MMPSDVYVCALVLMWVLLLLTVCFMPDVCLEGS